MLEMIAKLLRVLNSEAEPSQISLALGFGMIAGFVPFFSIYTILVVLIVFMLRVTLSAFFLGWLFFSLIAYLIDPFFHRVGLAVLTAGPLQTLWTAMYNAPFWRFQKFNNTVVMGSLLFSVVVFVPAVFLFNLLIRRYRDHVLARVRNTPIVRAIKASKFYSIYRKVSGWRNGS